MRNIKHLIRSGSLILLAIVGFTIVRSFLVPESFGKYGHYRADAVTEEMAKKPVYQGDDVCQICHLQKHEKWKEGRHQGVDCEYCHGQGKEHVDTKGKKLLGINRSNNLCIECHFNLPARPHNFSATLHPRIDPSKHLKDKDKQQCFKCHNPHSPDLKQPEPEIEKVVGENTETKVDQGKSAETVKKEGVKVAASVNKSEENGIGRKVYVEKCLSCHGQTGDGKTKASEFFGFEIGDLSASSYKSTLSEIIKYTRDGKGLAMIAYKDTLSEEEIKEVSEYIQGFKK